MKLSVNYQESYSRGELILRSFLGLIYILIPHILLLYFVALWGMILKLAAWWVILFTGKYPRGFFDYHLGMLRWSLRINARFLNLADGYPSFGLNGEDDSTNLEVEYPETLSRGTLLLRAFFGMFYVMIPHGILLYFRMLWGFYILGFIAFWIVLFTGKYPQNWHQFNVETLRWSMRVNLYMGFMTDEYPPFNGRDENIGEDDSLIDDTVVAEEPKVEN